MRWRSTPRSGGRLRSPALGVPRFQGGSPPVSRTGEGRALPRAYVAHRRTPTGSRRVSSELPPPRDVEAGPSAGAGIRRGHVHGKSDKTASAPIEDPVHPTELLATIYHSVGIKPDTIVYNHLNQPRELVKGEAVSKILA